MSAGSSTQRRKLRDSSIYIYGARSTFLVKDNTRYGQVDRRQLPWLWSLPGPTKRFYKGQFRSVIFGRRKWVLLVLVRTHLSNSLVGLLSWRVFSFFLRNWKLTRRALLPTFCLTGHIIGLYCFPWIWVHQHCRDTVLLSTLLILLIIRRDVGLLLPIMCNRGCVWVSTIDIRDVLSAV